MLKNGSEISVIVFTLLVVDVIFILKNISETVKMQDFGANEGQFFNGINKEHLPSFSLG